MSENKFIAKLKGAKSAKSVVEVQDPKAKKSFTGIAGTSDSPQGYSLDTASSVVVANGAENWTCGYGTLTQSADYRGGGSDYTGSWNADGAGLWMNATYTFPASDDPSNSTVAIINPNAKWVLTLFGAGLLSDGANVVKLKLVVQIGAKNIASKDFILPVHAFQFCEQLAVDFSESTTEQIKVDGGTQLNVQLLCEDENAHAQIFSGMTVLTLLDRKIDARDVASDKTSFDDLEKRVATNAQAIDVIESKIPDNASPTNKMATAAEISNLQTQITNNDNDIANLQTQITSNDTDIANLQSTKADKATDFQTPITSANKGATMAEITALDNDLQAQITSNDADILKNAQDITALQGAGGALTAYNFNTATPTQETLTKYAVDQIWVGNTNWAWNSANPAASTFTDANGVARTAAEIFNSTWVNNTYDDHRWQLTNTQNTTPKVFEWADVGRDIVSVATATTAGIVRVGDGSQMVVNASTGDISLDGSKAESIRGTIGALAANQGSSNSGLILGIDADGDVVPTKSSSGGRNIGDIFWTTRTDSALNGAVEANGAQYNFADVNGGDNNVQALLTSGALPSVSKEEFNFRVQTTGGCDAWAYNSSMYAYTVPELPVKCCVYSRRPQVGDPVFCMINSVPNEEEVEYVRAGIVTQVNGQDDFVVSVAPAPHYYGTEEYSCTGKPYVAWPEGIQESEFYNVNMYAWLVKAGDGDFIAYTNKYPVAVNDIVYTGWGTYVVDSVSGDTMNFSGDGYSASATREPNNDTLGLRPGLRSYDFKVPKKTPRILVRCQKPTADNNYAWYNVYADGWVEQGGWLPSINNTGIDIDLLITMATTDYYGLATGNTKGSVQNYNAVTLTRNSTQQISVVTTGAQSNGVSWRVYGYADASEYTKDKWDYQNVQVERPMVQLFNSATDEAVATCTSVLQDVANLNMGDYVIYWDSGDATDHSHAKPGVSTPASGTWYRLYKSGWVEQGGYMQPPKGPTTQIDYPIEMADTNYTLTQGIAGAETGGGYNAGYKNATITGFIFVCHSAGSNVNNYGGWQVSGMSAQ